MVLKTNIGWLIAEKVVSYFLKLSKDYFQQSFKVLIKMTILGMILYYIYSFFVISHRLRSQKTLEII